MSRIRDTVFTLAWRVKVELFHSRTEELTFGGGPVINALRLGTAGSGIRIFFLKVQLAATGCKSLQLGARKYEVWLTKTTDPRQAVGSIGWAEWMIHGLALLLL